MKFCELDEPWRRKVINSVDSMSIVFNTQIASEDVQFMQLMPECLWVNCDEEIDICLADVIENKLSIHQLAPITVVEYKGKYIIYMGSVRAVLFCRFQGIVNCIVVKLYTKNVEAFVDCAQKRLSEFDIY